MMCLLLLFLRKVKRSEDDPSGFSKPFPQSDVKPEIGGSDLAP